MELLCDGMTAFCYDCVKEWLRYGMTALWHDYMMEYVACDGVLQLETGQDRYTCTNEFLDVCGSDNLYIQRKQFL